MTRFARAKGSKSSNERLPEEATSWQDMKRQLMEKQNLTNDSPSNKNKKERVQFDFKKSDVTSEWAEFENPVKSNHTKGEKKKKSKKFNLKDGVNNGENFESAVEVDSLRKLSEKSSKVKKKSSKKFSNKVKKVFEEVPMPEIESTFDRVEFKKPVKSDDTKEKKKRKDKKVNSKDGENNSENLEGATEVDSLHKLSENNSKLKKKSSKEFSKKVEVFEEALMPKIEPTFNHEEGNEVVKKKKTENVTQEASDSEKLPKKERKQKRQAEKSNTDTEQRKTKKKKTKDINIQQEQGDDRKKNSDTFSKEFQKVNNKNSVKSNKFKTRKQKGEPYKRRKPEASQEIMFINGKEIVVVKFDGFPVKKEDAERLKELRKNMIARGIPKEEIFTTMKLERRKAEKSLARERKKVCFHCRKAGHILSECPELGESNESGTGICFKCGSTEHTHFECKVVRGQDFRYAECFICKEQGHIARQCPDNPRGLYPKGGACNVCGDVTHMKKDCPDLIEKKESKTITLQTLDSNSLETLDEDLSKTKHKSFVGQIVKKKAVVKF